jgi:murein L,D-transpeptidase YcbB/YkuD
MARALEDAAARGLDPSDYDGARWAERLARFGRAEPRPDDDAAARFDTALSVAALRYASDLSGGRAAARGARWRIPDPGRRDPPEALLARLAEAPDVEAALAAIEPPSAAYRRTVAALARYRRLAQELDVAAPLPPVPTKVLPGATWPGVPWLAERLRALGDLAPEAEVPPGDAYDGAIVGAVQRFQRRHGLQPDGAIGKETARQLAVPLATRVEQLELALERWRWVPRSFGPPFVIVNIPEFRLYASDGGDHHLTTKVVVGNAYRTKTPVFAAEITHVIFRPPWNVPRSIQRNELAPKIARDPGILARDRYDLVDRSGRVVAPPPDLAAALRSGALRLRQRPGAQSALGTIKFLLPNAHDVYLHGTPSRRLFERPRRDFSHGCIRVEDPVALAVWMFRDRPDWPEARIRAAMDGSGTLRVPLQRPVPILIVYATAVVAESGEVRFFDDLYGHDAALRRELAARRAGEAAPRGRVIRPGTAPRSRSSPRRSRCATGLRRS